MTDIIFNPDVKVTEQALKRAEKFRETKRTKGLPTHESSLSKNKNVYFNDDGEVMCVADPENFEVDSSWLTHDFDSDQVRMLTNKSYSNFRVVEDEKLGFVIKKRTELTESSSAVVPMNMVEVAWLPDHDESEITVNVTKNAIKVELTELGEKTMLAYKVQDYQIKNKKFMPIYITEKKNPNFLIYTFELSLGQLARNKKVLHPTPEDFTTKSVYTSPLLDYYGRV